MNSPRFHIRMVRAGDAARAAEHEPAPPTTRIEGGTSARMAEEARRAEGHEENPRASSMGFSLRASGGRVTRLPDAPRRADAERPPMVLSEPSAPSAPLTPEAPQSSPQTLGARLHAMFRTLQARVIPSRLPK